MAPHVERTETLSAFRAKYFAVDLLSTEPFDPALFDEQVRSINGEALVGLKHMVLGDKMYIFPDWIRHTNFYSSLTSRAGVTGELQCGGAITVSFRGDKPFRRIIGFSDSLELHDGLSREESNRYRDTVLKEKLGEFFDVASE